MIFLDRQQEAERRKDNGYVIVKIIVVRDFKSIFFHLLSGFF